MGKLLKDLHFSELKQELEARCLSTKGTKAVLRDRLELWLFRKGHDPKGFHFKDSLEKMGVDVKEIRDHLLSVETTLKESMKTFQEILAKQLGNITAKIEDVEKAMKDNKCCAGAKNTEANPTGNMGDKSEVLTTPNKKQDNFNVLKCNKVNDILDKKRASRKQESIRRPKFSSVLVDEASSISVVAPENDKASSKRKQELGGSRIFIDLSDDSMDDEGSSQQHRIIKRVSLPSKPSNDSASNIQGQIKMIRRESLPRSHSDDLSSEDKDSNITGNKKITEDKDKEQKITEIFDADLKQGQHASSNGSSSRIVIELSSDDSDVEEHTFLKRSSQPLKLSSKGGTMTTEERLKSVAHRLEKEVLKTTRKDNRKQSKSSKTSKISNPFNPPSLPKSLPLFSYSTGKQMNQNEELISDMCHQMNLIVN